MRIGKIYKNILLRNNHKISKITNNSNQVIKNSIFVAIKGYIHNGEEYIKEAIDKGALTIISSLNFNSSVLEHSYPNINFIKVNNPKKELALLFTKFYSSYLNKFKIIGITGTNGKTTTSNLLYKYLRLNNINTICFSSNGNYVNDTFYDTKNTTPDINIIYDTILNSSFHSGYIIIEISSQAISELRIMGINFDVVAITNITTDHIDYHGNTTDYFYTKSRLLYQLKKQGCALLNSDLPYFEKLNSFITNQVYTFGEKENCDFKYELTQENINNTLFFISDAELINAFETSLIGKFNIQNITIVYGILRILKINLNLFSSFIKEVSRINGRMNIYPINKRTIIIDYAHTIEAVKNALITINNFKKRSIKLVIGCGGNRDPLKRPIIGQLSCLYADFVYFTEDNSRNESLSKIIKEITCDLTTHNYMIIESRYEAIKKAVIDSKEEDIIVIMGKGCEKTKVDNLELNDLEMILKCFKENKNA